LKLITIVFLVLCAVGFGANYYVNGSSTGITEPTGTAQAGAADTITLAATASATDDYYNGYGIQLVTGTGAGGGLDNSREISDYDGSSKVATVSAAWTTTNPSSDTVYLITVGADNGNNDGSSQAKGNAFATMAHPISLAGNNTINVMPATYYEPEDQYLRIDNLGGQTCTIRKDPAETGTVLLSTASASYGISLPYYANTSSDITIENISIIPQSGSTYGISYGGIDSKIRLNNVIIDNRNGSGGMGFTEINTSPRSNEVFLSGCTIYSVGTAYNADKYNRSLGGFFYAENCGFYTDDDTSATYCVRLGEEVTAEYYFLLNVEVGDIFYITATDQAGVSTTISYTATDTTSGNVGVGLGVEAGTAAAPWDNVQWNNGSSGATGYFYVGTTDETQIEFTVMALDGGGTDTQRFQSYSRYGKNTLKDCTIAHIGNDVGHGLMLGTNGSHFVDGCTIEDGSPALVVKSDTASITNSRIICNDNDKDDANKYPITLKGGKYVTFMNNYVANRANSTISALIVADNDNNSCLGQPIGCSIMYNIFTGGFYAISYPDTAYSNMVDYNIYETGATYIAEITTTDYTTIQQLRDGWDTKNPFVKDNDDNSIVQSIGTTEGVYVNGKWIGVPQEGGDYPIPTEDCVAPPFMDSNADCKVDFIDFCEFASEWMSCGLVNQIDCWE
jgi:hypothetical protein